MQILVMKWGSSVVSEAIVDGLRQQGHEVMVVSSTRQAQQRLQRHLIDAVAISIDNAQWGGLLEAIHTLRDEALHDFQLIVLYQSISLRLIERVGHLLKATALLEQPLSLDAINPILTKIQQRRPHQLYIHYSSKRPRLESESEWSALLSSPAMITPPLTAKTQRLIRLKHARLQVVNHYEVLGIPQGADPETIRDAFHARSRHWHPDRFSDVKDAAIIRRIHELFQATHRAFQALRHPRQRSIYDRQLARSSSQDSPPTLSAQEQRRILLFVDALRDHPPDHYAVLGISHDASEDMITYARRYQSIRWDAIQRNTDPQGPYATLLNQIIEAIHTAASAIQYKPRRTKAIRAIEESLQEREDGNEITLLRRILLTKHRQLLENKTNPYFHDLDVPWAAPLTQYQPEPLEHLHVEDLQRYDLGLLELVLEDINDLIAMINEERIQPEPPKSPAPPRFDNALEILQLGLKLGLGKAAQQATLDQLMQRFPNVEHSGFLAALKMGLPLLGLELSQRMSDEKLAARVRAASEGMLLVNTIDTTAEMATTLFTTLIELLKLSGVTPEAAATSARQLVDDLQMPLPDFDDLHQPDAVTPIEPLHALSPAETSQG